MTSSEQRRAQRSASEPIRARFGFDPSVADSESDSGSSESDSPNRHRAAQQPPKLGALLVLAIDGLVLSNLELREVALPHAMPHFETCDARGLA